MVKHFILSASLWCISIPVLAQRIIPGKTIKTIEARMVGLDAAVFLTDSLYADYITNGRFEVRDEIYPDLYQPGSSLLSDFYQKIIETYPGKCSKCRANVDELNRIMKQEVDDESELQYNKIITKADACFAQHNFESAKEYYQRALKFRANDVYPKQKLEEITQLLAHEAMEKAYDSRIKSADAYFAAKNFEEAQKQYLEALKIKPEDAYSMNKIVEIDLILKK